MQLGDPRHDHQVKWGPEVQLGVIRLTTHIYLNVQHVVLIMTSITK